MGWKKQKVSLQKIEDEYSKDILCDDDRMYRIKDIIDGLDDTDKALLIIYADEESMAKTGKKFCVSAATVCGQIQRIRKIIKDRLKDYGY